jgi:hypothetical protein
MNGIDPFIGWNYSTKPIFWEKIILVFRFSWTLMDWHNWYLPWIIPGSKIKKSKTWHQKTIKKFSIGKLNLEIISTQ